MLCHHRGVFTARDQAAGVADLETRLASFIEQNRLPGGAAGVVCGDELAWSAGAGFADLATGKATDPVMLYGIASITKTFTGTAIMQLRDAGRLDWVSFQLRAYRKPGATARVLDATSLREMHTPRYLADDQWTQAWGISWCGTRRDDTVWTGHTGGIPGFTSAICFDPAAQVGAVVLVNGTIGSAAIAMDLAAAARELTRHRPSPSTLPAPAPENYQPLLGIYAPPSLGGWPIRLEWTHGKLAFTTAEVPGWQIILTPTADPDLFTIADGGSLSGGNVTFRRLADGRIASVLLMDSTWVRLDHVTA
jgi:CubicO group peptidase (beta-lactamase class C family)